MIQNKDVNEDVSFKPYYKWNTFNTVFGASLVPPEPSGFKPYYKWNTFNTVIIEFVGAMGRKF